MTRMPEPELTVWMRWQATPKREPKRKAAPADLEHRQMDVAAALDPSDLDEISQRAKEAAARIMADFDRKRGKR